MTTQLDVVNNCLAVMGEAPLNSLSEYHELKGAALAELTKAQEVILSHKGAGWWFNRENLTLTVSPVDGRIYLPADAIGTITFNSRPGLAKRGRVVYDLINGTTIFPAGTTLQSTLIRNLDLTDVPSSVALMIRTRTVMQFQNDYDGDQTKQRNLADELNSLSMAAESEHVRNRKVNILDSSLTVQRVRRIYYQSHNFYGRRGLPTY